MHLLKFKLDWYTNLCSILPPKECVRMVLIWSNYHNLNKNSDMLTYSLSTLWSILVFILFLQTGILEYINLWRKWNKKLEQLTLLVTEIIRPSVYFWNKKHCWLLKLSVLILEPMTLLVIKMVSVYFWPMTLLVIKLVSVYFRNNDTAGD